jgi:hypothetical protein
MMWTFFITSKVSRICWRCTSSRIATRWEEYQFFSCLKWSCANASVSTWSIFLGYLWEFVVDTFVSMKICFAFSSFFNLSSELLLWFSWCACHPACGWPSTGMIHSLLLQNCFPMFPFWPFCICHGIMFTPLTALDGVSYVLHELCMNA